ncbi:MAG: single-stranded-DNA-specific exonuclease RecJ [Candidatus Thermoplasmatota archaeon]|nr:single-stranded-DNA-specific exonuclease RecJ [Candidatus Thermoplasmatota archaeon]
MGTLTGQRWRYHEENPEFAVHISEKLDIHPVLARIMVGRSVASAEEAYDLLHPTLRNLHDPFLFSGMEEAVKRIEKALSCGEGITVHGDYDVDGISSTALLVNAFKGSKTHDEIGYFLPSRFEEGYGLSMTCLEDMKDRGDTLLITVDCGIKAIEEVKKAREIGIDVIVTDHHEPGPQIPDALSVIDPKWKGSGYPFRELAGVGVAFKLATALRMRELTDLDVRGLLDLVALGTVSDLVPLVGENRVLVHFGLEQIGSTSRIGLSSLMAGSGIDPRNGVRTSDIAFKIGPRLNSAGRLSHPGMALDLMLTSDRFDAELFTRELNTLNFKRQAIGKRLVSEILEEIEGSGLGGDPAIVVGKEGWNPGVIGVSAAKLVEITGKPSIILSIDGDTARGSARAPRGFNITEMLGLVSDILKEHGGHERAAGLTISSELVPELRRRFCGLVDELYPDRTFEPVIDIDLDLTLSELDLSAISALDLLGPFGMGNPQPVISIRDVSIGYDISSVGEGKHLKFSVTDQELTLGCIWFNMGEHSGELAPGTMVSIAGMPEVHSWRGDKELQLRVIDLSLIG